jgi:hypothetical protein
MTVTPTTLTRAAGVAAVVSGLLFIGVQINHPPMELASVTTTDWAVRNVMKTVMAALAIAGITGMYLPQVRKTGVLGLLGYVVFATGYLVMLAVAFVAATVLPTVVRTAPAYVDDVLTVAFKGAGAGDIGLLHTAITISGVTYVAGGLLFGIALFRAGVLARWASALLVVGTVASLAIPLLPPVYERLFAIPTGVAMVGLGYSLWRARRAAATRAVTVSPRLDPADAT